MEFGDSRSFYIEYPYYRSFGSVLDTYTQNMSIVKPSPFPYKLDKTLTLPANVSAFSDLIGRAIVITKN
jgi:hypothetical protein